MNEQVLRPFHSVEDTVVGAAKLGTSAQKCNQELIAQFESMTLVGRQALDHQVLVI